ncbi:MAG TPA: glycerol-3-phosphate dehydrogenase [Bauldia sp.]|nr:glycerol-3-phosphate dehydrogenase [Bauldia sp.]
MPGQIFDLAIIGGGVNGTGIARDAAGRGLSVFLCEERDLASGTSSASTKLIHGGLRYLEFYDFRLVHESLVEREKLLRIAPHIIHPLRLVLPHHKGLRPWPVIRLGLLMYDHLSVGRTLPATRTLDLRTDEAGRALKPSYRRGFEFSDCTVDDARLVVLNARDAADRGAEIRTRTRCLAAKRDADLWRLTLHGGGDPAHYETVSARALVNAGGPWVSEVVADVIHTETPTKVRLVKGSHIVVDRIFDHDRAYLFQNADGRVCFAIPYRRDYTLIGTTDEDYQGDPTDASISDAERDYLLAAVGEYLQQPIDPATIRWTYAGVRPLDDDGAGTAQKASRDYTLELDTGGGAPLLNVFGGKLTTYRRLSEHAMKKLKPHFADMRGSWTATAPLPGGDIANFAEWSADMAKRYDVLDPQLVARLCCAYGTRIDALLDGIKSTADLGRDFGDGLTEREVAYLVANEWATTADDILWRRTKLGLRFTPDETTALAAHLQKPRT